MPPSDPWRWRPTFAMDADLTVYWPDVRPCWEESPVESEPGPLTKAVAASLPRVGWLLAEALAGRTLRLCASATCRWSGREHYWAPDCR